MSCTAVVAVDARPGLVPGGRIRRRLRYVKSPDILTIDRPLCKYVRLFVQGGFLLQIWTQIYNTFCIATDLLIPDPALVPGGGMQISRNKPPSANGLLLPLAVARIASTARCDKPM